MIPIGVLRFLLWSLVLGLCGLGLVMIASTTAFSAERTGATAFLVRQLAAFGIGTALALTLGSLGPGFLRRTWLVAALAIGVPLVLALTPHLGAARNGATRWIDLGPIMIQPAELAKVALIVVMAWYLVKVEERVRVTWNGVLLPLLAFGILAVLVFRTRDLGSVVILAGVMWVMWVYSGANWIYSTVLGICCLPMGLYIGVFKEGYRFDRVMAFARDPLDPGNAEAYQLRNGLTAMGSGGETGMGLGTGQYSKNGFVPEDHTDFVFAVIGEELGFWGSVGCALAFLLLVLIGMAIAARTSDRHQRLLAVGATVLLGMQAFANMMVVTGLIPTKGLTLPFVSYGGTSLVVSLLVVGILDAVARACPETDALPRVGTTRIGAAMSRRIPRYATEGEP